MQRIANLTLAFLCLSSLLVGCDMDPNSVSMTIEQREEHVVPGLGLGGRVSISIGDIETSALVNRGPTVMEWLEVLGPNGIVLARDRNVGTLDKVRFSYDGSNFQIDVDGFSTSLVRSDKADLTVRRTRTSRQNSGNSAGASDESSDDEVDVSDYF